jgi:hypothetical protein
MGGAVPPLPQYAFMAWCSVMGSTGTTLPFANCIIPLIIIIAAFIETINSLVMVIMV